MLNKISPILPYIILLLLPMIYFYPFFLGFIPIPGDILLTTYFPWRNEFWTWNIHHLPLTTSNFWTFDAIREIYPWQYIGIDIIKNGQIPLWNPYAFAGAPLIANNQSAIFYPLNILYFMMDFPYAWGILTILQPLLGSLFLFFLLKEYQIGRWFCLWGAILFGWGGFMASYLHTHVLGHTLIWLPLSIFILHKLAQSLKIRWFLLFIFSVVSSLLAGHLQVGLYSLLIIFLYQIFVISKSFISKKNLIIISLLTISIAVSSPQLFPTLEFTFNTFRDNTWYTGQLIPVSHIMRLLVPNMFGHVALNNWSGDINFKEFPYVGILGLVFAIIGVFKFKSQHIYAFWIISIIITFFASLDSPFTRMIYNHFSFLQNFTPSRAYGIIDLGLAILSAKGLEWIWLNKEFTSKKIILIMISFLLLCLTLAEISLKILHITSDTKSQIGYLFLTSIILVFTLSILLLKKIGLLNIKLLGIALFLIGIGDVLIQNGLYSRSFTNKNNLFPSTSLISYLQKNLGDSRFLSIDPWTLPPNTFTPYHLNTVSVYDSTLYKYSYDFMDEWRKSTEPNSKKYTRAIEPTAFNQQLLNMLNIKYIVSDNKLNINHLTEVNFLDGRYVYENRYPLPYVFLTSDKIVSGNDQETKAILFNLSINQGKTIILSDIDTPKISPGGSNLSLINKNTQEETWKVNVNTSQLLYRAVSFNPGWQVQIDGKSAQIFRSNLAFQSVFIPKGEHLVKFFYWPKSFDIAIIISSVTLFFVISCTIMRLLFKQYAKN